MDEEIHEKQNVNQSEENLNALYEELSVGIEKLNENWEKLSLTLNLKDTDIPKSGTSNHLMTTHTSSKDFENIWVKDAEIIAELDFLRRKYENLQKEWDNQQEHLGRLQGEVYKLRNQLQTQSSFCASLGSIMGNLIWKASRLQPVVELLLTTNRLSEFFTIVSGTLVSFMETYSREIPDVKCDETQFILSMAGIIANVAAVPEGRQHLVTDANGRELLEQILRLIPLVPSVTGDPLKRILFMLLYNISINQNGLLLIQDQKPLLLAITHSIMCDRTPELKLMALRLLESISSEIPNSAVLNQIQKQVPLQKIELLCETGDAEVRQYAMNIINNVEKAEEQVGQNMPPKPFLEQDECDAIQGAF